MTKLERKAKVQKTAHFPRKNTRPKVAVPEGWLVDNDGQVVPDPNFVSKPAPVIGTGPTPGKTFSERRADIAEERRLAIQKAKHEANVKLKALLVLEAASAKPSKPVSVLRGDKRILEKPMTPGSVTL